MIRTSLLATAALAVLSSAALAQTPPDPCDRAGDPRVRCAAANPNRVIVLYVQRGAALTIELPANERVVAIPTSDNSTMRLGEPRRRVVASIGADDSDPGTTDGNLSVARRGNVAIIKPDGDLVPQPLFLMSEVDGKPQPPYRFELRPAPAGTEAFFSVRLRNVAAETVTRQAAWQERRAERDRRAAEARLRQVQAAPCASTPGANHRWVGRGADAASRGLAPAEICDNGRQTFMRFPGVMKASSIFTVLPDGREALVNSTPGEDGWVVVHDYTPRIILRAGEAMLCLINRGYNGVGQATGTRTISPDVVLAPRGAAS